MEIFNLYKKSLVKAVKEVKVAKEEREDQAKEIKATMTMITYSIDNKSFTNLIYQ